MRILIFGTFDLLHPGHRFVLDQAADRGDVTVVIARDHNVEQWKERPPAQNENERRTAVQEALPDATVILGDLADFLKPVRETHPDLILLGYDQQLPPGITESMLPCPIERLPAFEPEKYKSSLLRSDS